MKKLLILFAIPLLLFACSNKKKGLLLFPPGLLGGDTPAASTNTSAVASTGSSFTVEAVATDASQVTTSTTEGSSSTTSESSASSDGQATTTTTVTATTTSNVIAPTDNSNLFSFATTETVPVEVTVSNGASLSAGIPVTISEVNPSGDSNVLGQGTTDSNGSVTIPVSIPSTTTQVEVSIVGVNPSTGEIQEISGTVPTQSPTDQTTIAPSVEIVTENFQPISGCSQANDSDCDGVIDQNDEFPSDNSLVSTTSSGRYTIAFEDSYPNVGSADLNDHTSIFSTELDKTPGNKVKVLRGIVTHVSKGPGHDHELRLKLDVPVGAKFEVNYVDGSGNVWNGCAEAPKYVANAGGDCTGGNLSADQLKTGLLVIPNAFKSGSNKQNFGTTGQAFTANDFVRGITAYITVTFDEPVDLSTSKNLVDGQLNWFLATSAKTKGVFTQIYRPGYVFDGNGKDLYLGKDNFPYAIVVPGVFNHPTNGADIRKASTTGYAYFAAWAESKGVSNKDWYTKITNPDRVVMVSTFYTETGFSAYLIKAVGSNIIGVSASLIVLGAAMGFLLKRKSSKATA
ncbi:MAG: LruC domain-containing protein [Leptospira sp.]|nr:LruC domain-containing protein [Leptospira sp.]